MKLKTKIGNEVRLEGNLYKSSKNASSHNWREEQLNEIENMFLPINQVFDPEFKIDKDLKNVLNTITPTLDLAGPVGYAKELIRDIEKENKLSKKIS